MLQYLAQKANLLIVAVSLLTYNSFGAMPSSLISHQWEGDSQETAITISSEGRGELTPSPAVTHCPTVSVAVLKPPVQLEQL